MDRRSLLTRAGRGIGSVALLSMLRDSGLFAEGTNGLPTLPHFRPRARRAIWLFPAGAPSQIDTWDYKPKLREMFGKELPGSVRGNQRLTTMTSGQKSFPVAPSLFEFRQAGQSGTLGERALSLDREGRGPARGREVAPHRGDQPRAGNHRRQHGEPAPGPPLPRVLALLRARQPQREPAHLRGHDVELHQQVERPGAVRPDVEQRLPSGPARTGSPCAARAIRCST